MAAHITEANRKLIDKLTAEGKTPSDIRKITGLKYSTVYNFVHRFERSAADQARRASKPKTVKIWSPSGYVDTSKELPPTNPPGPITYIHADRECVESGLIAQYGRKLEPIVSTLAERKPAMRFTSQDRLA